MKRIVFAALAVMTVFTSVAPTFAAESTNLSERLKGHFLLSVQDRGKIWYVSPENGTRIYIPDATNAWMLIKDRMIGISNADLAKLPLPGQKAQDPALLNRLKGQFLLAVENHGEVWFVNPHTNARHYLGTGEKTYEQVKGVALGITLENLGQVPTQGRVFSLDQIESNVSQVNYASAELGWEFANTLWRGYESFKRDHNHYPDIKWFDNVLGWNQAITLTEKGFTLDTDAQVTYWQWENFSAEFYKMYTNDFSFDVNPETGDATMKFYLPASVNTPNYGTLAPGTYYFVTGLNLVNSDQYKLKDDLLQKNKDNRLDLDEIKSTLRADDYTNSVYGWEFSQSLWTAYEQFYAANEYYVGTQWLENIFEYGQAIYLTKDGFTLDQTEETFWVWSDFTDEFFNFYFNHFAFIVDAEGNGIMQFNLPEELETTDYGVLPAGTYYMTSKWGLLNQEQYDQLGDPFFVFDLEGVDVNKEAERIVTQVEHIISALNDYSAYVGGGYPELRDNAVALGENGRNRLTENGGFHPESNTGRVFLDNIKSGAPTSHIIYDSALGGKGYVISFTLYGSYTKYSKIYVPGHYEATPIGIRKVANLEE